jgi:hypothetical protein
MEFKPCTRGKLIERPGTLHEMFQDHEARPAATIADAALPLRRTTRGKRASLAIRPKGLERCL